MVEEGYGLQSATDWAFSILPQGSEVFADEVSTGRVDLCEDRISARGPLPCAERTEGMLA